MFFLYVQKKYKIDALCFSSTFDSQVFSCDWLHIFYSILRYFLYFKIW